MDKHIRFVVAASREARRSRYWVTMAAEQARAGLCTPGATPQALRRQEAWNRVRLVVPRV